MQLEVHNILTNNCTVLSFPAEIRKALSQACLVLFPFRLRDKYVTLDAKNSSILIMDADCFHRYAKHLFGRCNMPFEKRDAEFDFFVPVLTTACSLACLYCYGSGGKRPACSASWPAIKASIDYIANVNKKAAILIFPTGEQTLNFPLLKKMVRYVRAKMQPLVLAISTNGFITEKQALWLAENFDLVQVSCDGPPEIQDLQRPSNQCVPSSVLVERTIRTLVEHEANFKVRATLTHHSIGKEERIFSYFYKLGVSRLACVVVSPQGAGEVLARKMSMFDALKMELKLKELGDVFGLRCELDSEQLLGKRDIHTCPAGHIFTLGADSTLASCSVYGDSYDIKLNPGAEQFVFGRYDSEQKRFTINRKKLASLRKFPTKVKKCATCSFRLCWGECPLRNYQVNQSIYVPARQMCIRHKSSFLGIATYLFYKHVVRLTPRLEVRRGGKLAYVLNFTEFELLRSTPTQMRGNPFVAFEVSELTRNSLLRRILAHDRRAGDNMRIFLLSPLSCNLDARLTVYLKEFLFSLKEAHVLFVITKPLMVSERDKEHETRLYREFRIPQSCFDCLEMFVVERGRARFCNGMLGPKLSEVFDRRELYEQFLEAVRKSPPQCDGFDMFNSATQPTSATPFAAVYEKPQPYNTFC
jgi:radical SAM protein with 4Fe4S-binding SPASM domain